VIEEDGKPEPNRRDNEPQEDEKEGKRSPDSHVRVEITGKVRGSRIYVNASNAVDLPEADTKTRGGSLAEQRQRFYFDFLEHSLKQAEWTFRLSVYFMSGGAAVILVGAALALVHAQTSGPSYAPLVTALTGALITGGGGALAIHARRARAHVTEQANRIDEKIDLDHKLEIATTLIDRVDDPSARDRLNAAAAMKALDIHPGPEVMAERLLPRSEARKIGKIEPGSPTG
jgi:hypothetical protein